jgi:hypothetical protein
VHAVRVIDREDHLHVALAELLRQQVGDPGRLRGRVAEAGGGQGLGDVNTEDPCADDEEHGHGDDRSGCRQGQPGNELQRAALQVMNSACGIGHRCGRRYRGGRGLVRGRRSRRRMPEFTQTEPAFGPGLLIAGPEATLLETACDTRSKLGLTWDTTGT